MALIQYKLAKTLQFLLIIFLLHHKQVETSFVDTVKKWFTYQQPTDNGLITGEYTPRIPYEVSTADEKFISEAAKLTGVALSDLDSCQQRVVLKLQSDCDRLNDEQLAKMAVHLLNCQSHVEGRRLFPCTDEMPIKDCTSKMDSDTWTSYHLMSNRARAVCYSIRQIQFRGLAENTVNRLMSAAQNQLKTLSEINQNQNNLHDLAENTLNSLSQGQTSLQEQQQDLRRAQFHGQLALEDNIRRLSHEKEMIIETHDYLVGMTKKIQSQLENSQHQLENQVGESRVNHNQLIDDLIKIQDKAHVIFERIEESSKLLLQQNDDFKEQYSETLRNLAEVNKTVHDLVALVGGTRQALEDRLNWLTTALGGTDLALERLYLILSHAAFMLVSMLTCAFLSARTATRLVVATLPPLNLAAALWLENGDPLGFLGLTAAILGFVATQIIFLWGLSWSKSRKQSFLVLKEATSTDEHEINSNFIQPSLSKDYEWKQNFEPVSNPHEDALLDDDVSDEFNVNGLGSPTPPLSRSGFYSNIRARSRSTTPSVNLNQSFKTPCSAKTRAGTHCKLFSLPGREFCHRHIGGDSVMGS